MNATANHTPAIKFCGLSHFSDIESANAIAPDYVGFILWDKSKRWIASELALELRKSLDPNIKTVGVFVDEDPAAIAEYVNNGTISIVQLHGSEDERYIEGLRPLKAEIWKAFEVKSAADIQAANESPADFILLDAGKGGGKAFDWSLLRLVNRPFGLAGGLDAETVRTIQEQLDHPELLQLLDVSSGIESGALEDGRPLKDHEKMRSFANNVRKGIPMTEETSDHTNPAGRFGIHGGQYVPETLMNAVNELEEAYNHYKDDPEFKAELAELLNEYAGRPSRLYFARRMTEDLGGAKIYLKREDLNHTGAHKINNVLGQALLAKKMGKTRLIAETGAGQHGVATATAAALLGLECEVFMGREDTERQALNVYKMRLLGATVHPVDSGTATLKDAVSETMREWTNRVEDTHYCLGSTMGPHPFPVIVRDFQSVISSEIKEQMLEREGRLPDVVMACVGGGSNAMGTFYHFINDPEVRLIGCEAAGRGVDTWETAATISTGSLGIFHGMKSYFCQDEYGQIAPVYSISAGLDYPGIGPEHAMLHDTGRAEYVPITDDEAVEAFEYVSRTEGIIPAIESSHALAYAMKIAPTMPPDQTIVVTVSGRGDKDCVAIARYRGEDIHE